MITRAVAWTRSRATMTTLMTLGAFLLPIVLAACGPGGGGGGSGY